jgi:CubicO group peptidase (beta-lactamase class C family)
VEQVTGLAFPRYVEANVLAPCGMADSGYFAMDQLPARTAYGYIEEPGGGWHTNFYALPIIGGPDGGAFTTAPDLARFWEALLAHRLLSEAATQQLFTPHLAREAGSTEKFYGYGLWLRRTATGEERYMLGEDPGVMFYSGYFPRWEVQLTLLSNGLDTAWPMARVVRDALHAE